MNGDDIYGDLDDFDLGDTISKFEENKKALTKSVEESQKRIEILSNEVSALNKVNKDLKVNISELYKTAKAEIERKTSQLTDLRREMDDTLFRRGIRKNTAEVVDKDSADKENELLKQLQEARNTLVQKNRIIASLNKELQNARVQNMEKNESKRNRSLIDNENDDTMHKRPKNSHFDNGQTNYRKSNYKSKGYDDRRNGSGSKSPDRRKSYRNSDFKLNKDKRFNKFKDNRSRSNERGRYDLRDQIKDKHSNDRLKYKQQGYDNSRPEYMEKQLGKGQVDRFIYCNYNTSEFSNRSESSYNSRSSVDDRRHTSPAWCEKSVAQKHDNDTSSNRLQIATITHRKKLKSTLVKTSKEDLEEGELDSTVADSNEDSINPDNVKVNNLVTVNSTREILKEDIRNIVTVEDILQEPDNSVVRPETCKIEVISDNTDNAIIFKQVTCNTANTPPPSSSNESGETNTSVKLEPKPSAESVTIEQVARNETQPIVKRKITGKRRRCVVTIS